MVAALALAGGVAGLLGLSAWLERKPAEWTPEARIREAMRGPDGAAVRAEFRGSGIEPPARGRPAIPMLWDHLD